VQQLPAASAEPLELWVEGEHTCQCWVCRPGAFPPIPDDPAAPFISSESHPVMRPTPTWAWRGVMHTILLNGRLVCEEHGASVVEALHGSPGWLIVVRLIRIADTYCAHYCTCHSGKVCSQVLFGQVEIIPHNIPRPFINGSIVDRGALPC
jgi:hypothetical protein